MNKNVTTIVVQTPGEMNFLHRIRAFISGVAEEFGIDGQDIDNIELAVDEACANVIEHGYTPDAPDKHITIRMEIDPGKLVLTIIDQGKSFDPRLRQQPDIRQLDSLNNQVADNPVFSYKTKFTGGLSRFDKMCHVLMCQRPVLPTDYFQKGGADKFVR